MVPGFFSTCGIKCAQKLCIGAKLFQHMSVLTAHRAIDYRSARPDGDCPCGSDCDRAVDHSECRLEKRYVPGRLAHKVVNLEWVANMQHIDFIDGPHRRDIHTDGLVIFGNELEQRLANFP